MTRKFTLRLADLEPHLDLNGNLTLELPTSGAPLFTEQAYDHYKDLLGERKAGQLLDEAAELIFSNELAAVLAARVQ